MHWGRYKNLNALATTAGILGAQGVLRRVIINKPGASANTLTLYDNTTATGTVIAVIDTTVARGTLEYGVLCATGLSAIIATGTAADVTLVIE